MRKIAITAVLLLSLTLPGLTQSKNDSWLNGSWEGTGYQINTDSTWAIRFKASGGSYSIGYPSLGCGGEWRLISIDSSKAKFKERITYGESNCINNGTVTLDRINNKQLVFLYYPEGSDEVDASAILRKKQ